MFNERAAINSDTRNNRTVPNALGHPQSLSPGIKHQKNSNPFRDHMLFSLMSSTVSVLWAEIVSKPMNGYHCKCSTCFWSVGNFIVTHFINTQKKKHKNFSKTSAKIKNYNMKTPIHSSTYKIWHPFYICSKCAFSIMSISGERAWPQILPLLTTLLQFWQRSVLHMPVPSPKWPGPCLALRRV